MHILTFPDYRIFELKPSGSGVERSRPKPRHLTELTTSSTGVLAQRVEDEISGVSVVRHDGNEDNAPYCLNVGWGRSLADQLATYGSLAGSIGLAAQVLFAMFPVIQIWRR